jgi:hypothetical protein
MTKSLAIGVLSAILVPVFNISVNAQYSPPSVPDYTTPNVWRSINNSQIRQWYGSDVCYGLLSSQWRYYQRQRSLGRAYPDAEDVRLQRKWERRKGCPHLYESDGTVNRVKGIND